MTAAVGLRVNLYYGEGYTIKFSQKDTVDKKDVEKIAKEVFNKGYLVQNVEFFNDSAVIKVKEVNEEQLTKLAETTLLVTDNLLEISTPSESYNL